MIFPAVWNLCPVRAGCARSDPHCARSRRVVWLLFEYVFPWMSVTFGIQDQSVGDGS